MDPRLRSSHRAEALVAIVGPTGSGKSDLAVELSRALGGEIVGCDALQVYRGFDVGTAKLPQQARREVPHHLLDVASPSDEFSAARYVSIATECILQIRNRGNLPIVVGGTGLYLRALRYGLFEGPSREPTLRARLWGIERRRRGKLHRMLARWDPPSAARIHPNDSVRLVRALEVYLSSGRPMSSMMTERRAPLSGFRDILVGLRPGRAVLARRISERVESMYAGGLAEEVRGLVARHGMALPAFKAIGYRECLAAMAGRIDWDRAQSLTEKATIQYAKRQLTWFRKETGVTWFDGVGDEPSVRSNVLWHLRRELSRDTLPGMEKDDAETAS
ncbi:MAG TPA: tRNA (adenosine(37)-N6)-dimethylallyltransferase MiaA [Vicinamibacteria bacterium]|nr:tRNA (adenosine(37)-N6)-dimethylallyltransferase MiaA [Vicinamibacteria bacterium]